MRQFYSESHASDEYGPRGRGPQKWAAGKSCGGRRDDVVKGVHGSFYRSHKALFPICEKSLHTCNIRHVNHLKVTVMRLS